MATKKKLPTWSWPLSELISDQRAVLAALDAIHENLQNYDDTDTQIDRTIEKSRYRYLLTKYDVKKSDFTEEAKVYFKTLKELQNERLKLKQTKKVAEESKNAQRELLENFIAKYKHFGDEHFGFIKLFSEVENSISAPKVNPIANQALYVLTNANFESFISRLANLILSNNDRLLFDEDRDFKFREFGGSGGVQKIRTKIIKSKIDKLLHSSMDKWIHWFETSLKFEINEELKKSCNQFYDIRNLFIHESSSALMGMNVGNAKLLRRYQDSLLELASLVTCQTVKYFEKPESDAWNFLEHLLVDGSLELIAEHRYQGAEILSRSGLKILGDAESLSSLKVNNWISKKKLGQFQEIASEIRVWDVTGLEPVYELAKYALSGEQEKVQSLKNRLIDSGDLLEISWLTWPLFDDLR